jgi:hypothetical protein
MSDSSLGYFTVGILLGLVIAITADLALTPLMAYGG